jgi:hypothetical protein
MLTTIIILLGLIVICAIIAGITQADNDYFSALYAIAVGIVLIFTIAFVVNVNEDQKVIERKERVEPQIKIETIQSDSIIKSDTTYIYTFKKY